MLGTSRNSSAPKETIMPTLKSIPAYVVSDATNTELIRTPKRRLLKQRLLRLPLSVDRVTVRRGTRLGSNSYALTRNANGQWQLAAWWQEGALDVIQQLAMKGAAPTVTFEVPRKMISSP
jgi:hypothetical protein